MAGDPPTRRQPRPTRRWVASRPRPTRSQPSAPGPSAIACSLPEGRERSVRCGGCVTIEVRRPARADRACPGRRRQARCDRWPGSPCGSRLRHPAVRSKGRGSRVVQALHMSGHERRIQRAAQQSVGTLRGLGREIRLARLNHDLSQATAARAAGLGAGELGPDRARGGGQPSGRRPGASTGGRRPRPAPARLPGGRRAPRRGACPAARTPPSPTGRWSHVGNGGPAAPSRETNAPGRGHPRGHHPDRDRGGDTSPRRARLQRRLGAKQRDGGVDHVILLLADTRHNRTFLRSVGEGFHAAFPVDGRAALRHLEEPTDPGGNAIILL